MLHTVSWGPRRDSAVFITGSLDDTYLGVNNKDIVFFGLENSS